MSTACWRGYYATYTVESAKLKLVNLTIHDATGIYPNINGVPAEMSSSRPEGIYRNLGVDLSFTGQLRLANGFMQNMYVHMGYQSAHCFRVVYDLTFEKGRLVEVLDRSEEVAELRVNPGASKFKGQDVIERIEKAFSKRMDLD
jgi:hypothetical protein